MALVTFKKGLLANLPNTYSEGTFYVTTDERAIYLDTSNSSSGRIRIGDFQEFPTVEALEANTNPSTTALYYVTSINCLAKWNGSEYIQINLDTGATSVEVTGSGNAITTASYDATTRKITLTKGETFATKAQLDAAVGASTDASTAITLYGVKKYAQEQAAAVLGTDQDDKDDNTVFGAKAYADDAVANATSELIGENTDDKDDDTIYGAKAYADDAVATAKDELIGENTDTYSSDTITGAKKYADKVGGDLLGTAQDTSAADTINGAKALANEKVASVSAGNNGVVIGGTSTAPTVGVKLSEKAGNSLSIETGSGEEGLYAHVPTISVSKKSTANDDFAASYQVTVDGAAVGVDINIPKDYLVKSATVDTVVAADKASGGKFENNANFAVGDKYLDFVVNTKADGDGTAEADAHIYLNVADLAHIYTEGNGIDISASDVISVVIDSSNANGLSVGANGVALAQATDSVTGAMTAADHTKLTDAYEAITLGSF